MAKKKTARAVIHVEIAAETLFTIGGFEVTNSMVGAVLASLLLLAGAWYIQRRSAARPAPAAEPARAARGVGRRHRRRVDEPLARATSRS